MEKLLAGGIQRVQDSLHCEIANGPGQVVYSTIFALHNLRRAGLRCLIGVFFASEYKMVHVITIVVVDPG